MRIVATGLCHSDVTMRSFLPAEMFPNVFGHEGAGVVEEVGADVSGIEVGDHVVLSLRSCRTCAQCKAGHHGHCEQGLFINYMGMRMDGSTTYTRDGQAVFGSFFGQSSFSQHAIAYADNCVVVDKSLDLARLGPYGCGFQTGVGTMLNVAEPVGRPERGRLRRRARSACPPSRPDARPAPTIVAVDPLASRREIAASYGALTIDPTDLGDVTVVDKVKELTGGGATYGIDTTAIPEVVKAAQQSLAVRGTLIAIGLGAEEYADRRGRPAPERQDRPELAGGRRRPAGVHPADARRWPTSSTSTGWSRPTRSTRSTRRSRTRPSGKVVKPVLVW